MTNDRITSDFRLVVVLVLLAKLIGVPSSTGQLRSDFYDVSCPNVTIMVRSVIQEVMLSDPTIAGALLRQQYHDCFVNGCDASNLLDNSGNISSEKGALLMKFARGFEVIDKIKTTVEASCPGVVSCADIITIAAEASVSLSGGPSWSVMLGRRDSTTASPTKANAEIPASVSNFNTLASKFFNKGLNLTDLVALSGAHSLGHAHCSTIKSRLYNYAPLGSQTLNSSYLTKLQEKCPKTENVDAQIQLDCSPLTFDNSYFKLLQTNEGLLISDQAIFSTNESQSFTLHLVKTYSLNQTIFFDDFVRSMIKMANINPLTGNAGEIRQNCRKVNNANLNKLGM